jgi:hypothetical protein
VRRPSKWENLEVTVIYVLDDDPPPEDPDIVDEDPSAPTDYQGPLPVGTAG